MVMESSTDMSEVKLVDELPRTFNVQDPVDAVE